MVQQQHTCNGVWEGRAYAKLIPSLGGRNVVSRKPSAQGKSIQNNSKCHMGF